MKSISVALLLLLLTACSTPPPPPNKPYVDVKVAPIEPPFAVPTTEQLDYLDVLRSLQVELDNEEIRQLYIWVKAEYDYFYQTEFVTGSLLRGNRYLPYLQYRLRQADLPIEYSYLAMIESAFRTVALSNKGAHGVWQLMPATAKELGIRPEQRKDVVKATDAAIKYIQARQQAFANDALLIAASYNAGEYGVSRRFEKVDSGRYNFVTIYDHLPKETRHYVPRWIAATMLANQIKRQGKMPPSDAVIITKRDYQVAPLAKGLGMDVAQFEQLNPDFVGAKYLTNQHNFIVHPNVMPVNAVDGIHISAATGFTPQFISAQNDSVPTRGQVEAQLRKTRLAQQAKQAKPKVKLSPKTPVKTPVNTTVKATAKTTAAKPASASAHGYIQVEIKPGMTYTRLSRWFGVSQQELITLNPSLKQGLQAGKQIKVPAAGVLVKQYKVQQGDSLMQIARQHRLELDDIRLVNQIKDNHIRVGQVLTLYLPQG